MAGEVKHQWNGSVLTVISDSGASSADLKGPKGDTGPRGPQGPAGVVYDENGELVIDLSIFYTTGEIDEKFANYTPDLSNYPTNADLLETEENLRLEIENKKVDLSGYATEKYVDQQITNVATGGSIDLGNYYTKAEVDNEISNYKVNADEKTIVTGADGKIRTAIGGYYKDYLLKLTGLNVLLESGSNRLIELEGIEDLVDDHSTYYAKIVYADGFDETVTLTLYSSNVYEDEATYSFTSNSSRIKWFNFYSVDYNDTVDYCNVGVTSGVDGVGQTINEFYLWDAEMGYNTIDPNFIPVDNSSIKINSQGKLYATGLDGEGVDLTDYATMEYVDSAIAAIEIPEATEAGTGCNIGAPGTGAHSEIFNDYSDSVAQGMYAHAEGYSAQAYGNYSHAEGYNTDAAGEAAHSEGQASRAVGSASHAEGYGCVAEGFCAHAEGNGSKAEGDHSHAEGDSTARGTGSHAEGGSFAYGDYSHAEGFNSTAYSDYQHVQGKNNLVDYDGTYAHIVGNGTGVNARSNAHTLDWSGNAWFAGNVEGTALILMSPNGTRYQITVNDSGVLNAVSL